MAEKDLDVVKRVEHELFRAQLTTAMDYLSGLREIDYFGFLEVHRILFSQIYPWAGQDRAILAPDIAVKKGRVFFCSPVECRRAVEYGLRLAQHAEEVRARPGHIMGLFAYGHPFLDGNGRTMLVVHAELCFRAGMSIQWERTDKRRYLKALSEEIENPNASHLDKYLRDFIGPALARHQWRVNIGNLSGLSGIDHAQEQGVRYDQPEVKQAYLEFERSRAYEIP